MVETMEYGSVCLSRGNSHFSAAAIIATWNVSLVMPDFPLFQEKPEVQIFIGSLMFSTINNLKNTV